MTVEAFMVKVDVVFRLPEPSVIEDVVTAAAAIVEALTEDAVRAAFGT
jgi:hypothetical protein